jgi:hypothetical protein
MSTAWPESDGEALMRINRVERWVYRLERFSQFMLYRKLNSEFRLHARKSVPAPADIRLMQINAPGSTWP